MDFKLFHILDLGCFSLFQLSSMFYILCRFHFQLPILVLHYPYSMVVTVDYVYFRQGNRTHIGGTRETDDFSASLREGSPQTSSSSTSHYKAPSGSTDYTSPSSSLTSLCEDADSGTFYSDFMMMMMMNWEIF